MGTNCHIQQTVDHDPSIGAVDFQCGPLTYDGHTGTDFALPSLRAMQAGVDVLAAAPGTVIGTRDGMPDALQVGDDAPDVGGRECGNGVILRHQNGWETQYCHMAEGSIAVAIGDDVATGDVLGRIGLSGQTQFPHLHLAVRDETGANIDPFVPDGPVACGITPQDTLWADKLELRPGGLIAEGFADSVPDYERIKAGDAAATEIDRDDPLVVWAYVFGGRAGDTLHLRITGPRGHVMDESTGLETTQSQLFRAIGRPAPQGGWADGAYIGDVQLIRDGAVLDAGQTMVLVR